MRIYFKQLNPELEAAIENTPPDADDKPDPDGSEDYDYDKAGNEAEMDDTLPPTVLGDNNDAPF